MSLSFLFGCLRKLFHRLVLLKHWPVVICIGYGCVAAANGKCAKVFAVQKNPSQDLLAVIDSFEKVLHNLSAVNISLCTACMLQLQWGSAISLCTWNIWNKSLPCTAGLSSIHQLLQTITHVQNMPETRQRVIQPAQKLKSVDCSKNVWCFLSFYLPAVQITSEDKEPL